jgi:uncharacterized protein with ATP-grasp and redox domains
MSRKARGHVLDSVRAKMRAFSRSRSPVEMAVEIHQIVRAAADHRDPYKAIKEQSNRACAEAMNVLSECMNYSLHPFETATKLAIAGNVIDFGVYSPSNLSGGDVIRSVHSTIGEFLVGASLAEFRALTDRAARILYIGDNAGECFLDTFLLDQLPLDKLIYVVRGSAVLNDATQDDARAAGIHERCEIIDTGDDAPGVLLHRCSEPFRRAFNEADLVIAKGQGNYESLSETAGTTCVFLTKVKCPVVARHIGHAIGNNVIRIMNGTPRKVQEEKNERRNTASEVHHA